MKIRTSASLVFIRTNEYLTNVQTLLWWMEKLQQWSRLNTHLVILYIFYDKFIFDIWIWSATHRSLLLDHTKEIRLKCDQNGVKLNFSYRLPRSCSARGRRFSSESLYIVKYFWWNADWPEILDECTMSINLFKFSLISMTWAPSPHPTL